MTCSAIGHNNNNNNNNTIVRRLVVERIRLMALKGIATLLLIEFGYPVCLHINYSSQNRRLETLFRTTDSAEFSHPLSFISCHKLWPIENSNERSSLKQCGLSN